MLRREDRLFATFCRRTEPGLLARVFDKTAPELLRMAMHLTGDRAIAEDLVQETFVTAIETRARFDARRGVTPWLFGILVNHVMRQRRAARRVPDPARLMRDHGGDPVTVAEQREFHGALAAAIGALPDVYQPVVRLHLEHGLTAVEIATALGRPAGTVRTQVVRGIELLRKALPPGFAAAGAATLTAGRGLAAVRDAVLANVPMTEAATTAAAGAGAMFFFGMLTMQKVTAGAVLLGVLATAGWWWASGPGPAIEEVERARSSSGEPTGRHEATPAADVQPAVPGRALLDPSPDVPRSCALHVQVLWSDASPAADVGVYLTRADAALGWGRHLSVGRTGADGVRAVHDLSPGVVFLSSDRGGTAAAKPAVHTRAEAVVRLSPGLTVRGQVVDEAGAPVSRAKLLLSRSNREEGRLVASTDDSGRFVVRDLQERAGGLVAEAPPLRPSRVTRVEGSPGTTVTTVLTMGPSGYRLQGRVLDEDGSVAPRAVVGLAIPAAPRPKGYNDQSYELFTVDADDEGRFVIEWAPAGEVVLVARRRAPGDAGDRLAYVHVHVDPRTPQEVQLVTRTLPAVAGVARDDQGRPLGNVRVSAEPVRLRLGEISSLFTHATAATAADGSYRLIGLIPGPWRIYASVSIGNAYGPSIVREVEIPARGEARCDLMVPRGHRQRVRLLDPQGRPLAEWRVIWRQLGIAVEPGRQAWTHNATESTDADGVATAEGLPDGALQILVHGSYRGPGSDPFLRLVRETLPATEAEVSVQLGPEHMPTARATGRIVTARGEPLANARVSVRNEEGNAGTELLTGADGRFALGPLVPIRLRCGVFAEGHPPLDLGTIDLLSDSTHDFGDVRLSDAALVAVRLRAPPGVDLALARVSLGAPGEPGRRIGNATADAVFTSHPLYAGRFAVWVESPHTHPVVRAVDLAEGQHLDLTLDLQAAPTVTLALTFSRAAAADGIAHGELRVADGAGSVLVHERIFGYFDDLTTRLLRREIALLPGDYIVEARDYVGRTVQRAVAVAADGPPPVIAIDLE